MAKMRNTKVWKMTVVVVCLLSAIGVATAFGQQRNEGREDDSRCRGITGRFATALVTENCTSPVGLCGSGVVTGDRLIRGTTFATVLGLAPSLGLTGLEPETTLSIKGERTITTAHGALTFDFVTVFDTARGEFAEINRVTGGTERLAGATGTLWITGTGTTVFDGRVTGQVCTRKP
jgi:hypothetical protein